MRVVSGKYKRKQLKIPNLDNTRPTTDRIRESIFNLIGPYFESDIVLDLFAGSGALGIEALSRGAKEVYFVDNNKEAISIINNNLSTIKEDYNVIKSDYKTALEKLKDIKFDIVFLDPPYENVLVYKEALNSLTNNNMLNKGAIIVCEHKNDFEIETDFEIIKNKKYGNTTITILEV